MIVLEDRATWPPLESVWRHRNGNSYSVLFFTNVETNRQADHPTTIVYENRQNGKLYSRPLMDWDRSMTREK